MTRDQLLAALLVERYAPTRPEYWDSSQAATAWRRRELKEAIGGGGQYQRRAA